MSDRIRLIPMQQPTKTHIEYDPKPWLWSRDKQVWNGQCDVFSGNAVHTNPEQIEDPVSIHYLVSGIQLDQPTDWSTLKAMLSTSFSPSPCSCEHDCCGHRHGYAHEFALRPDGSIVFTVSSSRNY